MKWPDRKLAVDEKRLWLLPLLVALAALALWEAGWLFAGASSLLFPKPSAVLARLVELVAQGKLQPHLLASLRRLALGFALGAIPGLGIGLAMGWSARARGVLDPVIAALHPVPKVALFPLFLLLFGLGEASKLVAIALSAFYPVALNAMAGVRSIPPVCFEVARSFGAGRVRTFWRVVLPGSLPMVVTGARIGANSAFVLTLVVEIASANVGLGHLIWTAWESLRTADLYAAIAIIAAIGIGLGAGMRRLARAVAPWQTEP
jgi:ABC-type nitrate/sulfonate/bicarbonate transport system permease component